MLTKKEVIADLYISQSGSSLTWQLELHLEKWQCGVVAKTVFCLSTTIAGLKNSQWGEGGGRRFQNKLLA